MNMKCSTQWPERSRCQERCSECARTNDFAVPASITAVHGAGAVGHEVVSVLICDMAKASEGMVFESRSSSDEVIYMILCKTRDEACVQVKRSFSDFVQLEADIQRELGEHGSRDLPQLPGTGLLKKGLAMLTKSVHRGLL